MPTLSQLHRGSTAVDFVEATEYVASLQPGVDIISALDHLASVATSKYNLTSIAHAVTETSEQPNVLLQYVGLYFQHFHPLWPLLCTTHFDARNTSGALLLTICAIGSMYGTPTAAQFGQDTHEIVRSSLLKASLDLQKPLDESAGLCHTLLLNQVTALYTGQKRAFFFAQQLGAMLMIIARRGDLFQETGLAAKEGLLQGTEHCHRESRRRLTFGILRVVGHICHSAC